MWLRRKRLPRLRLTRTAVQSPRQTTGGGRPSARRCRLASRLDPPATPPVRAHSAVSPPRTCADPAAQFQQPELARLTEDELLLSIELNVQLRRDPTTGKYSYYVLKAGAVKHGRGRNGGANPPL